MKALHIAKTQCGKTVKVYTDGSDWQVLTSEPVKYKELWFTVTSEMQSKQAIDQACDYNGLTVLEFIY
jgi:hypothetical protein